jgi:hypothetical protein
MVAKRLVSVRARSWTLASVGSAGLAQNAPCVLRLGGLFEALGLGAAAPYNWPMPEPPSASIPAAPLYEWRIIRLRGTPGTFVGYVNAPDQEQAIQKAAENFGIVEEDRWQLGAYKVREVQR